MGRLVISIRRACPGSTSAISKTVYEENETDEGAPLTCKGLVIGRKVNGTRVDGWPMFVIGGQRNVVGEDEGTTISVTDFKRASTVGVVGGEFTCLFAIEDIRFSEVEVVEIRRFLRRGTSVPSFSFSESILTRPSIC